MIFQKDQRYTNGHLLSVTTPFIHIKYTENMLQIFQDLLFLEQEGWLPKFLKYFWCLIFITTEKIQHHYNLGHQEYGKTSGSLSLRWIIKIIEFTSHSNPEIFIFPFYRYVTKVTQKKITKADIWMQAVDS